MNIKTNSLNFAIFHNLILLLTFIIGEILLLPLKIFAVGYFLFVILVWICLRKFLCSNCCYYGELCNTGWGKIASLMFKRGDIGEFKRNLTIAKIYWAVFFSVPLIFGAFHTFTVGFKLNYLILLGIFFTLGGISLILHFKSCNNCKMNKICLK